ncbi:MAG TPA: tetratricopeptide repeat protein [Pyrinomonadaceae bacterium]|nr:tetratricopeptide repeat protein [Pyrinomonadaceae bacterium]
MKVSALVLFAAAAVASAQLACNRGNANQPASASATPPAQQGQQPGQTTTQAAHDAAGFFAQGVEHFRRNRDREAVEAFRKAVELDPEYAEAYHRLGMAHAVLGEREEAEEAFEKAVDLFEKKLRREPKDADALYRLADAYGRTGDYQKASETYRRAEKLRDPDASTYYDMGLVYNKLAKYQEAAKAFEKAVELDPNDYRAQEAWDRAREDASKQKARIEHEKKLLERQQKRDGGDDDENKNGPKQNNSNQNSTNTNRQTGTLS